MQDDDHLVAWVSLDDGDREATSFWTYVILALDRAVPGSGAGALTLLRSGRAAPETVLVGVVNELSVHPGEVTVVLDDYHHAEGLEGAEVSSYLNDLDGLDLTPADLAAIEARTEGWVAALQLAALSLRDRDDRTGPVDDLGPPQEGRHRRPALHAPAALRVRHGDQHRPRPRRDPAT